MFLFLIGILIGTAMIAPGLSGGVIAVIFNVYDKMIESLVGLFKDFKKNFKFVFILGLGILVGAIFFSNIILYFYKTNEVITRFSFVGLILGGSLCLLRDLKNKNRRISYKIMIISFIVSTSLFVLSNNVININLYRKISFSGMFISGMLYSIGKVLPGISSSFLLMLVGMYEYVLEFFSNPLLLFTDFKNMFPFILGLVLGVIILLIISKRLFDKYYDEMYSVILGFVFGSIPAIFPSVSSLNNLIFGVLVMIFSFLLSYNLSKR